MGIHFQSLLEEKSSWEKVLDLAKQYQAMTEGTIEKNSDIEEFRHRMADNMDSMTPEELGGLPFGLQYIRKELIEELREKDGYMSVQIFAFHAYFMEKKDTSKRVVFRVHWWDHAKGDFSVHELFVRTTGEPVYYDVF